VWHSPLSRENLTIARKRCKIGGKLVLITNRKSYMSFRLVVKSMTFNDLERRNGRYIALFQLITASSSIELIDQKSVSITLRAVNLLCVTKLTQSWTDTKLPVYRFMLLTFNLLSKFHFTVAPLWRRRASTCGDIYARL